MRAVLLALAASVSLLASLLQFNPAVQLAEASVEKVAVATTGVYVSLRVINAALSAAQEIEIGASVGAQASVQPLKVLEPVDDTVERVADVVFAVAVGAAVAAVGLEPVAALGAFVLAVGLTGLAMVQVMPKLPPGVRRMAGRATRLGAAVAIVLPLITTLGLEVGERMTRPIAAEANAVLSGISAEAQVLIGGAENAADMPVGAAADTLFGRLAQSWSAAGAAVDDAVAAVQDYRAAAGVFLTEADALFAATLTLIGVFVLRTIVLPVLLFWGVLSILRRSME
jgi:hypothetical protein